MPMYAEHLCKATPQPPAPTPRPAFAGGFAGEGIKTVIPASATAKLAARLVADQRPQEVLEKIEAHLREHHPPACNVTIRELGFKGAAFVANRNSLPMKVAAKVGLAQVVLSRRRTAQLHAGNGAECAEGKALRLCSGGS